MLPATAPAHDPAVIASPEGQVTAHTRSNKRQGDEGQPPEAKLFVTGVTRARVRVVSFGVGHAVVEHAVRAPHEADSADAASHSVGSILTLPPPVFLMVKDVPAIDTPRPLPVGFPLPRFAPGGLSLDHGTLDVFAQVKVRVADVRVIVIVF